MESNYVLITIYGADQICPSCVGAPGSKDTYEWLQAAIGRKYIDNEIKYNYIDIDEPQSVNKHKQFIKRIMKEELFYPVVLVNGNIVAEGTPRLRTIYHALDEQGVSLQ